MQARRNRLRVNLNWTAEAKVLVIITYHLILGVAVLTIFTNSILEVAGYTTSAFEYFRCENNGVSSNGTSMCTRERSDVEGQVNPIPTTIAFVLLGLYPMINLVYTINVKELRAHGMLVCMERKVLQVAPLDNRGNIQSIYGRPPSAMRPPSVLRPPNSNGGGGGGGNHVTSSFSYGRPSTFRPLQ